MLPNSNNNRGKNQHTGKTQLDWLIQATQHPTKEVCILWPFNAVKGYGRLIFEGRHMMAHRVSYKLMHGAYPEPKGLHDCDTSLCVNPLHVHPGTQQENVAERVSRGRNGHRVKRLGEDNLQSRLKAHDIMAIRRLSNMNVSMGQLAKAYDTTTPVISNIIHGKRWKHLPVFPPETRHGDQSTFRDGSRNGNSKLSENDVAIIRRALENGQPRMELANKFGVSRTAIRMIAIGRTWKQK